MSNDPKKNMTAQEYLEFERASQAKHEFFRGDVYAMSGASRAHNLICSNLVRGLHQQFDNRSCEVYSSDMRVKVDQTGLYTYPDVVVCCGDIKFEDGVSDTLLNPQLIVEVLSESTETYDRSTKFRHYQKLEPLKEYVIVSQKDPFVEVYKLVNDQKWTYKTASSLQEEIEFESIGCCLKMSEIYDRVDVDEDFFPLKVIEDKEPYTIVLTK